MHSLCVFADLYHSQPKTGNFCKSFIKILVEKKSVIRLVAKRSSCYERDMDKYENIKSYNETDFKTVTGVTPTTFEAMLQVIKEAYAEAHKNRGRHRKLSCEDMLLMTLEYYKEYRTLACMGASYGLQRSNVGKTIKWVEDALHESSLFSLPSKRTLAQPNTEIEVIVVDTIETPIQRPKCPKKQRDYYSGKKTTYSKLSTYNRSQNRNNYLHQYV